MLQTNAVLYVVDDLAIAREQAMKHQPPFGSRDRALLPPPRDGQKTYGSRSALVEVVSWGVWIGINLPQDRIIETMLRVLEEGRYGKPAKYIETDTIALLMTRTEYVHEISRQLSNMASVLSSYLPRR